MNSAPGDPNLSIVVLSWNTHELLAKCLHSLEAAGERLTRQVIVVDNASEDGSADMVAREFPGLKLIRNARNEGYARGNNIGIRASRGRHVLLLNSDTEVLPGSLGRLVAFLDEHPDYGAVGAGLRNADGSLQHACMRFPSLLTALFFDMRIERLWPDNPVTAAYFMRDYDHAVSRDVDQPPGACLLLRRAVLDQIGLLDEELYLYFNDVDLCYRIIRAGHRIRYLVEAPVIHHVGKSTEQFSRRVVVWHRNRLGYYRKHFGRCGEAFVRLMVRWRGLEEGAKIRASYADPEERAAALRELRGTLREILEGGSGPT